jgi:stage IV sporulation protein FB
VQVSLFGIPIRISPSFFLLAAVLAYGRSANPPLLVTWLVVVLVSVLVHELGHALAFRRFGHSSEIELHSMGGHTQSTGGGPLTNGRLAVVSLAGPLAGFVLAALVFGATRFMDVASLPEIAAVAIADLLWVNIGWGIFNLLPILPMDGGHVMRLGFRQALGERGELPALICSTILALLGAAFAYYMNWVWLLIMTSYFAVMTGLRARDLSQRKGDVPH